MQSNRNRNLVALALAIILCAVVAMAETKTFSSPAVSVADGDSIRVMRDGEPIRIRLVGIDAPERDQPFGAKARQYVRATVGGQTVTILYMGFDRFDRMLGLVILSE